MAPQLTEYERQRLENIKRNGELMASLKIQSHISELSSAKRKRAEKSKSFKISPVKKEDPVIIRRSMRTRGMTPDSKGLNNDFSESSVKMPRPVSPASSPRVLGPLGFQDSCLNSSKSDVGTFTKAILSISNGSSIKEEKESGARSSIKEEIGAGSSIKEEIGAGSSIKEEFGAGSSIKEEFGAGSSIKEELGAGSSIKEEFGARSSIKEEFSAGSSIKEELGVGIPNRKSSWQADSDHCKFEFVSLSLNPENIARVVPGRVFTVKFFPTHGIEMMAVGNKFGNVGFWNMKTEDEDNSIHLFNLHSAPISGILIHPFSISKVYTSCYDGMVRAMNIEKQIFDLVYSVDDSIYSLAQKPDDVNSIYMGEGQDGVVNLWDERMGKISSSWNLHGNRINSIDFSPSNTMTMATSSTDRTACIWDLRKMSTENSEVLREIEHKRAVHSAYFSPSGIHLATTSIDDTIGVASGRNFEHISMIQHNNQTGRWLSKLKAIWGWDDEHLYIGSMTRGVDIVSVSHKKTIDTMRSELMTAIPCRFDAHPCNVGALAGATAGGQVYVWTPPS